MLQKNLKGKDIAKKIITKSIQITLACNYLNAIKFFICLFEFWKNFVSLALLPRDIL